MATDTVNKELSTFQVIFQMGVEHSYMKHNLVREVKRDKSEISCERFRSHDKVMEILKDNSYTEEELKEIKRYRYFTEEQMEQILLLAKGKRIEAILLTFMCTGMRRRELTGLKWTHVDLNKRMIFVHSKKQSQKFKNNIRTIPITARLHVVLEKQKLRTNGKGWVFPGQKNSALKPDTLSESLRNLVKGTEFEGIGTHAFRHSIASLLAVKGKDQREIDQILGHQTETMRKRYQHLFPQKQKTILDNFMEIQNGSK